MHSSVVLLSLPNFSKKMDKEKGKTKKEKKRKRQHSTSEMLSVETGHFPPWYEDGC